MMNSLIVVNINTTQYTDTNKFKYKSKELKIFITCYIVEFSPLTKTTEDLNYQNEVKRLYFENKEDGNLAIKCAESIGILHNHLTFNF